MGLLVQVSTMSSSAPTVSRARLAPSELPARLRWRSTQIRAMTSQGPAPNHIRQSAVLNSTRTRGNGCGSPGMIRRTASVEPSTTLARAVTGDHPQRPKACTSAATSLAQLRHSSASSTDLRPSTDARASASSPVHPVRWANWWPVSWNSDVGHPRFCRVSLIAATGEGDLLHPTAAHIGTQDGGAEPSREVDEHRRPVETKWTQELLEAVGCQGVEPAKQRSHLGIGACPDSVTVEVQDGLKLEAQRGGQQLQQPHDARGPGVVRGLDLRRGRAAPPPVAGRSPGQPCGPVAAPAHTAQARPSPRATQRHRGRPARPRHPANGLARPSAARARR